MEISDKSYVITACGEPQTEKMNFNEVREFYIKVIGTAPGIAVEKDGIEITNVCDEFVIDPKIFAEYVETKMRENWLFGELIRKTDERK
jgi:hypothetical protein